MPLAVDMSTLPTSHPRDLLASAPALSLSLAGIFQGGGGEAEEGEGGIGGGDAVEISSENSGAGKSRSDDDYELAAGGLDDEDEDENVGGKKRKRKKYHRHTPQQIREMEALFKESPHPDEKQRLQLSKQLGLHPRQVKFWFQNRRTQIKAIQERHENSLLKSEIDKLCDENKALRESIKKQSCPNCGFPSPNKDGATATGTEGQKLRIENARLKAEVEKLKSVIGKFPQGTSPRSSSSGNDQENRSSFELFTSNPGLEKTRIMEAVSRAADELRKMASHQEPLWVRSYETRREILNYDEYRKEFCAEHHNAMQPRKMSVEASRETALIFVDLPWLVQTFMDANQWKELFPCLVSKAATVDVICNGEGPSRDGAAHLMFAEIQMLTPLVATREVYFVRYSKQISVNQWAIVDVTVDRSGEDSTDASLHKCRKRPSGCIIEDKSNSHCKVTWVEHLEYQRSTVHSLYRTIVNSGLAFGAKHWLSTLQQQCDRLVFIMATNVPVKDSSGVATLAGRKSILKLAQRMSKSFCRALADSSFNSWNKITSKTGDEIRVATRNNHNDPGEPLGTIMSAVTSLWLPIPHHVLFDFLREDTRRNEWDIMSKGSTIQTIANLAKGQDRGNAVMTMEMKNDEHKMWVLQDSSTNAYESMILYAPVDIKGMQSVITGCDSSNIVVLPSGFSILPDGIESRPLVIMSRPEEKGAEGGSLLTMAFQILISNTSTTKLSMDSVESVNTLISSTLQNIKTCLQCED